MAVNENHFMSREKGSDENNFQRKVPREYQVTFLHNLFVAFLATNCSDFRFKTHQILG